MLNPFTRRVLSNPKNYRGITLLPMVGKLFIQILSNRITLWTEKHNILCEAQYGFHKGRRNIDPILICTQIALDANLSCKKYVNLASIFLARFVRYCTKFCTYLTSLALKMKLF